MLCVDRRSNESSKYFLLTFTFSQQILWLREWLGGGGGGGEWMNNVMFLCLLITIANFKKNKKSVLFALQINFALFYYKIE